MYVFSRLLDAKSAEKANFEHYGPCPATLLPLPTNIIRLLLIQRVTRGKNMSNTCKWPCPCGLVWQTRPYLRHPLPTALPNCNQPALTKRSGDPCPALNRQSVVTACVNFRPNFLLDKKMKNLKAEKVITELKIFLKVQPWTMNIDIPGVMLKAALWIKSMVLWFQSLVLSKLF